MNCRALPMPAPQQLKVLVAKCMPKNTICAIRGGASLWSSTTRSSIRWRGVPELLKIVKIYQCNSWCWVSKSKRTTTFRTPSCQTYSRKVCKMQGCHHPDDVLMPLSPFSSLTLILVLIRYQQYKVYRDSYLGNLGIGSFRSWYTCYQQCTILHILRYWHLSYQ